MKKLLSFSRLALKRDLDASQKQLAKVEARLKELKVFIGRIKEASDKGAIKILGDNEIMDHVFFDGAVVVIGDGCYLDSPTLRRELLVSPEARYCTLICPNIIGSDSAEPISTVRPTPRTCGARVSLGQGPDEICGNWWGAMLIQCAFCKGHDAAMRGEP